MKKIGILFGQENTFPQAFIERINEKKINGIMAEAVSIEKVAQGEPTDYAVIVDRISQDVPFYRAYLKNAAIGGAAVINNPFWWSADEKFFNNALAMHVGVAVPKTVILPSHGRPADTTENSFRNLKFPMDWKGIFEYIGFPAYMKPHAGGGWKSVYQVKDAQDLFNKHSETDQLVMMLQEEIDFKEYFRCYCLGGNDVHIMQYEPRNPHHLRYVKDGPPMQKALLDKVRQGVIKLNKALGYDFNTVEFAVRDGIPYAIDFCNPAPDADVNSVGEENFEWIVEHSANMAIERAKAQKPGQMNLTWGSFIKNQVSAPAKGGASAKKNAKSTAKKSAPKAAAKPAAKKESAPKAGPKAAAKPAVKKESAPKSTSAEAKPKTAKPAPSKPGPKPKGVPVKRKMTAKATEAPKRMVDKEMGTEKPTRAEAIKKATAKKPATAKKTAAKKVGGKTGGAKKTTAKKPASKEAKNKTDKK
ncbi:hypothetical protein [Cryomorpha ignava]|uniref:hypothetical protein n=1 Tax=Cryomorpha ignava TaxID=101383 RepID=UPI00293BBA9C|nr:hypothetical protein [Cryomorpha ignava]